MRSAPEMDSSALFYVVLIQIAIRSNAAACRGVDDGMHGAARLFYILDSTKACILSLCCGAMSMNCIPIPEGKELAFFFIHTTRP